ncbi:hypothetical protein JKF63_06391 [Porcisia hertigi]|uniref:HECT-type E3 ubiquitin transferase n=1 Tax=Porcisia hertigi TaxID=2761500 RepID=A0A836LJU9_9TRYP|nr:hypothetical protein JKF63_06391 [Porcisia hertigi]
MDPHILAQLFDTFTSEGQSNQPPWGISVGDNAAMDNQGDYIRFESNGREWRVLQMGASEDETNLPPYRGDTQLRDAVRALPPVCFAPLLSQYTRLLRDPRWEVRHVPLMMEAMLNDRVLFNLMDTSPLSALSESRVSATTRWWGLLGKPVLRYENSTGRPLMSLIDGYESLSSASPGTLEGQQSAEGAVGVDLTAGGIDEQRFSAQEERISDAAAAAASAVAGNQPRISLEEVRQGYRDIKTVLTLIAATSAPYRCSRPPNASVSGCTARIVFCKDPSTIYLGLLLNSVLRGMPRSVLYSMSVFRVIAEGWGSSPSFFDILRASWGEYNDIMCDIRALLGLSDPAAEASSSVTSTTSLSSFSCVSTSTGAPTTVPARQQSLRRQAARRRLLPPMRLPVQHSDGGGQGRHPVSRQPGRGVAGVASSGAAGRSFTSVSSSAASLPHTSLRQTRTTADARMQGLELGIPIRSTTSGGDGGEDGRQSIGNNTSDFNDFVTGLLGTALNSLSGLSARRSATNGYSAGQGIMEATAAGIRRDGSDAPLTSNSGVNGSEQSSAPFRTEDANAICHESMLECAQNPELLLWWARCRLLAYQLLDNSSRMSVESTGALEYFREVWACTPLIRDILEDDQEALLSASCGASPLSVDGTPASEGDEEVQQQQQQQQQQKRARRIYATLVGAVADLSKFWFSIRVAQSTVNAVASRAPETNTVWSIVNAAVPSRRRFQREQFASYAEHWQYALLVDDYVTQPMCFRVSTRGRTMVTQLLHILSEYPTFYPALVTRTLAMLNRREMIVAELNERLVNAVARCLRFYLPPMPPAPAVPKAPVALSGVPALSTTLTGRPDTGSAAQDPEVAVGERMRPHTERIFDSPRARMRLSLIDTDALPPSWDFSSPSWLSVRFEEEEAAARDEGGSNTAPAAAPPQSTAGPSASGGDDEASTRGGLDYEALVAVDPADEVDGDNGDSGQRPACSRGKDSMDAMVRRLREEEAKMPVITVKAYEAILTCLDVLRMLVRNAHISVNPMNLLFTVPTATIAPLAASVSPTASLGDEAGGHTGAGDNARANATGHSPVQASTMSTGTGPVYETVPRSNCDLYTLLQQLVYQTRYGSLASAALRLFSVCVHYNVRDMVPLFAERGLVNTVLTIARRPRFVSEDLATRAAPLLFKLDILEENGMPHMVPHELAQAASTTTTMATTTSSSSSPSPLLIEHPPPELLVRYIPAEDPYLNDVAVRMVIPEFVEAMTVHKATHSVFLNHTEWIKAVVRGLTVTPEMSAASLPDIEALFDESLEMSSDWMADFTHTSEDTAIGEDKTRYHAPCTASPSRSTVAASTEPPIDHVHQQQLREDRVLRCRSSAAYERLMRDLHSSRRGASRSKPAPASGFSVRSVPHCRAATSSIDVALTRMVELHRLHLKREEVGYKILQGSVKEMQRVMTEVLPQSSLTTTTFLPVLDAELCSLIGQTRELAEAVRVAATEPHPLWRSRADGDAGPAAEPSAVSSAVSGSSDEGLPIRRTHRLRLLLRATQLCRTLNNFFAFFSACDFEGPQRRHWLSRRNPEHEASYRELEKVLVFVLQGFDLAVNRLWSLMGSHAPLQLLSLGAAEVADVATSAEEQRETAQNVRGVTIRCGHALPTRARLGGLLQVYEQGNADGASSLLSYVQATIGSYLHARVFGEYLRSVPPSTRLEETLRSTVKCILHFSSRDVIAEPEVVMYRGGGDEAATDTEGATSKAMRRRCLKAMKRVLEGRGPVTHLRGVTDSIAQPRREPGSGDEVDRDDEGDAGDCASDGGGEGPVTERVRYQTSEAPCKDVISSVLRPLSVGDGAFLRQLLEAWRVSRSGSSGGGGGGSGLGRREGEGAPWRGLFSEIMQCVVDALVVRAPYTADEVTGVLRSLQAGTQHSSISTCVLSLYDRHAEAGATVSPVTPAALPVVAGMGGRCSSEETSATGGMDASDQILQAMLQDSRSLLNEPSTAWMTAGAWVQATTWTTHTPAPAAADRFPLSPTSAAALTHPSDAGPTASAGAAATGGSASREALRHSAFSTIVVPSVLANPHTRGTGGPGGHRSSLGGVGHGGDSENSVDSSTALSLSPSTSMPPLPLATDVAGGSTAAGRLVGSTSEEGLDAGVGGFASSSATAPPPPPPPPSQPLFTPINAAKALQQWVFLSLFTGRRVADQPTRNFFYLSPYRRDSHVRPALPLSVTRLLRTIWKDLQAAFEDAVCGVSADAGGPDSLPGGGENKNARELHASRSRTKPRARHNSDAEVTAIMANPQERSHTVRRQPRHDSRAGATAGNDGFKTTSSSTRAQKRCGWLNLDARALAAVSLPSFVDVEKCLGEINFAAARRVLWELAVLGSVCAGGNSSTPEWESALMQDMLTSAAQFMILLSRLLFSNSATPAESRSETPGGGTSPTSATTAAPPPPPPPLSQAAAALKDQLQRYLVYMAVLLMNFLECSDTRTRGRHYHHVESLLYCVLDVWPKLPGFPMVPHVYVAAMEAIAQLKQETLSRMSFRALSREWQAGTEASTSTTLTAASADGPNTLPSPPSPHARSRGRAGASGYRSGEGEGGSMQDNHIERGGSPATNSSGDARRLSPSPRLDRGPLSNTHAVAPPSRLSAIDEHLLPFLAGLQGSTRSQLSASLSSANEWCRALPWVCDVAAGCIFPLDTLSETGYRLLRRRVCRALWNMWTLTNAAEQQYVVAYMLHRVLSNVRDNVVLLEYVGVLLTQLRGVVLVEALALTHLPRAVVKAVRQAIDEVTAEQHAEEVRLHSLSGSSDGATAAAQREFRQRRRRYYARIQSVLHGQLVSFLSVFRSVRSDAPLVANSLVSTAATHQHVQPMGMQCSYFDATRNTFCWCGHQCHRQHVVPVNGQRGRDGEEHRFALNTFGEGTQRALDEVLSVLEHHGFACQSAVSLSTNPFRSTNSAEGMGSADQGVGVREVAAGPYVSPAANAPTQSSGQPQAHCPPQRVVQVPSPAGTASPNTTQGQPHSAHQVLRRTLRGEPTRREHPPTGGSVSTDLPGHNGDVSHGDDARADAARRAGLSPEALAMVEAIGIENYVRLLRGEGLSWLPLSGRPSSSSSLSRRQARGGPSAQVEPEEHHLDLDDETLDVLTHFSSAFGMNSSEGSHLRHRLLNPLTNADLRSDPLPRSIIPHFALFSRDVCEEVVRLSFDFMAARLRDEALDRADAEAGREEQHLQQQQCSMASAPLSAAIADGRLVDGVVSTPPQFPSSPIASPVSAAALAFGGAPPTCVAALATTAKVVASRLTLPRVEVVECSVSEVMIHFLLMCFSTYHTTCMHLVRTHRPAGPPTPPAATSAAARKGAAPASCPSAAGDDVTSGYTGSLGVVCAYITQMDTSDNEKATLLSGLLLSDMGRLEEDVWQHMVTVLQTAVRVHQQGQRLTEKAYAELSATHLRLTRASMGTSVGPSSPSRTCGKAPAATTRKGCSHGKPYSQAHGSAPSATAALFSAQSQAAGSAEEESHTHSGAPGALENTELEAVAAAHRYLIPLSIFLVNLEPYIIRYPIAFYHAFCRYCEVRWVRAAAGEVPAAWLGVWVQPRPQAAGATSAGLRGHSSRATRRHRSGAGSTLSHDFVKRVQCFMQHLVRNVEGVQGRAAYGANIFSAMLQLPGVFEALLSPNFEIGVPSMYAEFLRSTAAATGTPSSFAQAAPGAAAVVRGGEGGPATSVGNRDGGAPAVPPPLPVIAVPPFLAIALYFCPALVGVARGNGTNNNNNGGGGGGRHTAAGSVDFATAIFAHDPIVVSEAVVRTLNALVTAVEMSTVLAAPMAEVSSQGAAGAESDRFTSRHHEVNEEAVVTFPDDSLAAEAAAAAAISTLAEEMDPPLQSPPLQQQQQQYQQPQPEAREKLCRLKKSFARCLHDVLCFLERGSPQPATVALSARQRATSQRLGVSSAVQQTFLCFFDYLGRLGLLELLFRVCMLQSCDHGRDATSLLQLLAYQLLAVGKFRLAESLSPQQRQYAAQQRGIQQYFSVPREVSAPNLWVGQVGAPSLRLPDAVPTHPALLDTAFSQDSAWPPSYLRERAELVRQLRTFVQSQTRGARITIRSGVEGDSDDAVHVDAGGRGDNPAFTAEHDSGAGMPDANMLENFFVLGEYRQGWDTMVSDYETVDDDDDDGSSGGGGGSSSERDGRVGHDEEVAPDRVRDRDTWPPMQPVRHTGRMESVESSGGNEEELGADAEVTLQRSSPPQALSPLPPMPDAAVRRIFENPQRDISAVESQQSSLRLMPALDGDVRIGTGDSGDVYRHPRAVTLETYESAVLRSLRAEDAMEQHREYPDDAAETEVAMEEEDEVDYSNPEENDNVLYVDVTATDGADAEEEEEEGVDHLFHSQPEGPGFFVSSPYDLPQVGLSGDRPRGGAMEEEGEDDDRNAPEEHRDSDSDEDSENPDNEEFSEDEEEETDGDDDNDDDDDNENNENEEDEAAFLYYGGTGGFLSAGSDRPEDPSLGVYAPGTAADGGEAGTLRHGAAQQVGVGFATINGQTVMSTRNVGTASERAQSFAACAYRAILLAVRPLAVHNVAETETPPLPVLHATEEEAPTEVQAPEASRSASGNPHGAGDDDVAHQSLIEGHQSSLGATEDTGSQSPQRNSVPSRVTATASQMAALLEQHTPSDQLMRRVRDSRSPLEATAPSTTRAAAERVLLSEPSLTAAVMSRRPAPEANTTNTTPAAAGAVASSPELEAMGEVSMLLDRLNERIRELFAAGDAAHQGPTPQEPLSSPVEVQREPVVSEQSTNTAVMAEPPATSAPVLPTAPEPWEGILNPQFLIEMPEDVCSEILFDSMNVLRGPTEREVRGQRTRLYPGFLDALPEDAQRHAMEVEARWVRVTGADNNATELYQTLLLVDAETRRDLLLQCDLELLRSYPEVLREATELRAEVERAREEAELAAQREQERRQRLREQAAQQVSHADRSPRSLVALLSGNNTRDTRGGGAAPSVVPGARTNSLNLREMGTIEGLTRVLFGSPSQLYAVVNHELFVAGRRCRCESVLQALNPPTFLARLQAMGLHTDRVAITDRARSSGLLLSPPRDGDGIHDGLGLTPPQRASNRGGNAAMRRAPPRRASMAVAGAAAVSGHFHPPPLPLLQLPPSAERMAPGSSVPSSAASPHAVRTRGSVALAANRLASRSNLAASAVPSVLLAAVSDSMVPVQETVYHALTLPLPHVPEVIVSRCIELLRLRATAPVALPNNRLTSVSCLDEELQRVMQVLMSDSNTAARMACQLLDLMAATPTMISAEDDGFSDGAAGVLKQPPTAVVNTSAAARVSPSSLAPPSSRSSRTLSTSELAANRQFIKDATMLFVSLVKQNQPMVAAFFLLPDGTLSTSTLKPLDAPLDEAEQRAVDYGLWDRLWRVARQHAHVPSFMLALDKLLQRLLRCQRSMLTASEDNEVSSAADLNGNDPLTDVLIAHPRHPHRLQWINIRLLSNYEEGGYICNICGTNPGFDYCFHCSSCLFDLCSNCSRERVTLAEQQQRMRRAAALTLQSAPETVKSMMRLLRHPLCRSDTATSVVQLMSLGLQECGAREGVSLLPSDAAGPPHSVSPRVSPIQLLEQELIELADVRVRAMKTARDEFRKEAYAILHARPNSNGTSASVVNAAALAPTRSQLGGCTSASGLSGRHTWQQLRIPEGYIFDTDTVMALLVKLDIKNTEGDVMQLLFEPYVATMRSEPRAFTMLWRASQAYLLDVSTLLEHVTPKEVLPLPSCVSSILQTFCRYHMSESRLLGTSASARALTDSRSNLAGETEHFLRASTKPSSVSDRAVRELAEQPDAAQCMTAAGTRLSEEGLKSTEELLHRRLPRVVRMVLEENRTTLNTLFYWDGNLIKNSFSFLKYEPNLIDFNFKLSDFRRRLGMRRGPNILLRVNRQTCLVDSFKELQKVKSFGGQLHIRFHAEEGADAGGLTREWLKLLSEALVDESYALFIHSQDGMSFQPNPFSSVNPNHLEYFQFAGVVTGLAIAHNVPIDIHFTRAFYRHIIGHRPVFSDLQSFDPELYTNLNWIMENDVTDLGLTFAVNYDRFGSVEEEELEPNGKDTIVTNANKQQYVRLLCEYHMTKRTEGQLLCFLKGFYAVIPRREIQCFTEKELELVISGMPNIDIEDLRTHTVYEGYSSTSPQVRWFWEAVGSMSKEDLANLLQFTTGSSKVPHGGFRHLEGSNGRSLPFTISRWAVSKEDLLPQAHTCFNKIDLPVYTSAAVLKERLMLAITYGSMGFTMV